MIYIVNMYTSPGISATITVINLTNPLPVYMCAHVYAMSSWVPPEFLEMGGGGGGGAVGFRPIQPVE